MENLPNKKALLTLSAFVVINCTSCSKDATDKLTDGTWNLVRYNNQSIAELEAEQGISDFVYTFEFEEDGHFNVLYSYTDDGDLETYNYSLFWEWVDEDNTQIAFRESPNDEDVSIIYVNELTKSKLDIRLDAEGTPNDVSDDWEMEFER